MDYLIKEETLTDIADAIRGQTGDENPIAVSNFASEISSIVGGGSHVELTQAEYDALTEEEKNNGSVYFITDTNGSGEDFQPVIYSLDEREIGVWTDGKPLYEKTYIFSSTLTLYRNTWTVISALDDIASVVDKVISGDGYFYVSAGGGYQPLAIQYSEGHIQAQIARYIESSNITQMTIRYTKSTDTAGSGIWTPQGVPAVHFSTNEHIIGTWIDGSTLYEKTLYHAGGVSGNVNIYHGVTNIDKVISWEGFAFDNPSAQYGTGQYFPLPRIALDHNDIGVGGVNSEYVGVTIPTAFNQRVIDIYITIRYTKSA